MSKDDKYAISVAKTEYREAYNSGDVDRLLAVFASAFTDWSDGEPSFYGEEARRALRLRAGELFGRYDVEIVEIMFDVGAKGDFAYDWDCHKVPLPDKNTGDVPNARYRYLETCKKEKGAGKNDIIITKQELH